MSQIFKTTALSDEMEWFFVAALKGKMHASSKEEQLCPVGSQQTPISFGLSEGYLPQDIANFYITRELGENWQEVMLSKLEKGFLEKLKIAFSDFRKDSQLEVNFQRKSSQTLTSK